MLQVPKLQVVLLHWFIKTQFVLEVSFKRKDAKGAKTQRRDRPLPSSAYHSSLFTYHYQVYLAGTKTVGLSYVTPMVRPELGLKFVSPLIPAKSNRKPEARICIPKRASDCDSVPSGPVPGRVFARPLTSPAKLNWWFR